MTDHTGHERLSEADLAAVEATWKYWLTDPERYDPRAGGMLFIDGGSVAETVRDGLALLAEVRALRAEVGRLKAQALELALKKIEREYGNASR